MKLFVIDKNLDSYRIPSTKLIVCLIVLIGMYFRDSIFPYHLELISGILTVVTVLLVGPCILVFFLSLVELCCVYHNKVKRLRLRPNSQEEACVAVTDEQIRSLITKCDIIEFEIFFSNEAIIVGASSDFDQLSGKFFDKRYYIGSKEFTCVDLFFNDLSKFCSNSSYCVVAIDGVSPRNYLKQVG